MDNKESIILEIIKEYRNLSSKEIFNKTSGVSYATVKRILTKLQEEDLVVSVGKRKATKYKLSPSYQLFYPINIKAYYEKEIDEREIKEIFNFKLIRNILPTVKLFTKDELSPLRKVISPHK